MLRTVDESVASDFHDRTEYPSISRTQGSMMRDVDQICLVGPAKTKSKLVHFIKDNFPRLLVHTSERGDEHKGNADMVFVLEDFHSDEFRYLNAAERRILGPTVFYECAHTGKTLPFPRSNRPLYCQSMRDVIIWLNFNSRIRRREMVEIADLVHYMGGSLRKEFTTMVTHLLSATTQNEEYRQAISLGKTVLASSWIHECWKQRDNWQFCAIDPAVVTANRLAPFYHLRISFEGFNDEEVSDMKQRATDFGAEVVEKSDVTTHFVVDTMAIPPAKLSELELPNNRCHITTAQWFWASIQLGVCANEQIYAALTDQPNLTKRLTPSRSEPAKRPRRSMAARRVASSEGLEPSEGNLTLNASSEVTLPEFIFSTEELETLVSSGKGMKKRQLICGELLQTEKNYLEILKTLERIALELEADNSLINKAEWQLIFGKLPPLVEVHTKICAELVKLINHWKEDHTIGKVWKDTAEELLKCYPPFVNNFDKSKETLVQCDQTHAQFHAFLKVCQSRPECHRQTLQELLIRPVQRLPSVVLLLNDILKHTDKNNPDHGYLTDAKRSIETVLLHINEDKRKTEHRVKMFEVYHDIENCPPELLSSQREFLTSIDVIDLTAGLSKKAAPLTFYLFNDILEITKRRQSAMRRVGSGRNGTTQLSAGGQPRTLLAPNTFRTPHTPSDTMGSSATLASGVVPSTSAKSHKHIDRLILSSVRRVTDVAPTDDSHGLFSVTIRNHIEDAEMFFQADSSSELEKRDFLKSLCSQVISIAGRTDVGVHDRDITDEHEVGGEFAKNVAKALRYVKGGGESTRQKLSRQLSFAKPSGRLQKAMSHISIGFGTLKRMSRSNLRLPENLNETTSSLRPSSVSKSSLFGSKRRLSRLESVADGCDAATPSSSQRRVRTSVSSMRSLENVDAGRYVSYHTQV